MKFTIYTRKGMPLEVEPTSIDESGWYFRSEDWKDHICDAPEWEYQMPDHIQMLMVWMAARDMFLRGYAFALIQAWYTERENMMDDCDKCDRLTGFLYERGALRGVCRDCLNSAIESGVSA